MSLLLILECEVQPRVLIEVKVEGLASRCEVFIRLWDVWTVLLNLLNLLKMLFQSLGRMWRIVPLGSLFNYCGDRRILNHDSDIDRVVHPSENPALVRIWNVDILE